LQAFASCVLAITTWGKSYSWSSSVEHTVLAVYLFLGINISFSEMQLIKITISFVLFIVDIAFLKKDKNQHLPILRYLLGSWRRLKLKWQAPSCHAWLAIDDRVFHADFDNGEADTGERIYGLTPKPEKKRALIDIMCYRFYAPCVGFGVPVVDEKDILNRMNCGKCHDFAAITLYSLSCHKFLTYSMVYVRWMSWIVLAVAVLIHEFLYYIVNNPGFQCKAAQLPCASVIELSP